MKVKSIILILLATLVNIAGLQAQDANLLILPELTALPGSTVALPLNMDNSSEVVAVEFNLQLPEGSTLQPTTAALTNRAADHTVIFRNMGTTGSYHCLIFSPSNSPLLGRTGKLMTVNMNVSEDYEEASEHEFMITDVVLVLRDGRNGLTATQVGKLTMQKGPDLFVHNVQADAATYVPGTTAVVGWQVSNIGAVQAAEGWTEYLFARNDDGVTKLLSTTYYDEALAPNAEVGRQVEVVLPTVLGMDGDVQLVVEVQPYTGSGESQGLRWNNTASTDVTLSKQLTLTLPTGSIAETYSSPIRCTLSRSGNRSTAETFTLIATQDSRLSIPQTVIIDEGQGSTTFYINITDNSVLDEISLINITASGNDYPEVSGQLDIEDNEYPDLTVTTSKDAVSEGETFQFTITASRAPQADLTVSISSESASRFTFPKTATIQAGESSVTVDIKAVDDDIPSLAISNAFTAYAPSYNKGQAIIILEDNDVPALELTLTPNKVSESDGPVAVAATLRRTGVTNNKITVKLSDDSNGGIYYGIQTIELPKGTEEAHFNIGPIDNTLVDGDRVVNITAAVYISSCSCNATGESAGVVSSQLTILDDDGPALKLTSAASTLKEGGSTTLTVSRNTDTTSPLTVTLSSDKDNYLTYNNTVVIPAGQTSVTVDVVSQKNDVQGDSFTAVFSALADGFSSGTCFMMVTDQTLPDARVSIAADKTEAEVGSEVMLTVTVSNEGNAVLPAGTEVVVYGAGTSRTLHTTKALEIGEIEALEIAITLPTTVGTARCYAVVNNNNVVSELNSNNNTTQTISVQAIAPFNATISVDKAVYSQQEPVYISGQINGNTVANQRVEVYITGDGYRKTIEVTTDPNGSFSTTWTPQSGQIGQFKVGARFPSETSETTTAMFDVLGYNVVSTTNIQPTVGETSSGTFRLYNPCSLDFTGVEVEVLSVPDNCEFNCSIDPSLKGRSVTYLSYTLKATSNSEGNQWQEIPMRLTTAEGISSTMTLRYFALSPIGVLNVSQNYIKTTMQKDATREYELTITNTGKGTTGEISLSLPSWMKSATGTTLNALEYGQSATIVLQLTPTADMQLNVPETGNIAINCENAQPKSISFSITPVSTAEGTLVVDVADEYTYNTSEAPHVSGATVVLRNPATNALVAQGTTGEDGLYTINLSEGYYRLSVTSGNHDSFDGIIEISPEMVTNKVINLSVQAIQVDWDVKEKQIKDEYEVVTTLNFETNVPVPVVELTVPNTLDVDQLAIGESLIFYAMLTNKGLIAAKDAALLLPEGFKHITFEPLSEYQGLTIAPQQSLTIPVKVTRVSRPSQVPSASSPRRAKQIDDDPCIGQPGTLYFWDCGADRKWHRYSIAIQIGSCNSNDPTTWNPTYNPTTDREWTGGWPAGTYITSSPTLPSFGGYTSTSSQNRLTTTTEDKGCEPCQNGLLIAGMNCLGHLTGDAIDTVKDLLSLIFDNDKDKNKTNSEDNEDNENNNNEDDDDNNEDDKLQQLINELESANLLNNEMAEELKVLASDLKGFKGLMDLCGKGKTVFTDCSKLKQSMEFDNIHGCYSALSDFVDGLFDEAMNETIGKYGNISPSKMKKFKSFGKKLMKWKKLLDIAMDCAKDFVHACDHIKEGSNANNIRQKVSSTTSRLNSFLANSELVLQSMEAYSAIDDIMWGAEPDWMEVSILEMDILNELDYENMSTELLMEYKPEEMRDEVFINYIQHRQAGLSQEEIDELKVLHNTIEEIDEHFIGLGYTSATDYFTKVFPEIWDQLQQSQNSVCASITLEFKQNVVMTRQAFEGTLTVFNGHETEAMTDAKLTLMVTSEDGDIATEHEFDIRLDNLEGFGYSGEASLTQGWTLDAQATGTAIVQFTPSKYAAPTEPKQYSFGGTLTYVDPFNGLEVTRILTPVTLTVNPTPDLVLTYFMQRDIYGDDPLTLDVVEPSVPAEFALLINNIGYGDANDVRMQTRQPEIVDNEKGLDISFSLISSQLNGGQETPAIGSAIATQFGDIPAQSTTYAQWWFKSSLLGHFTEYDIAVKPISYSNPDMSLINLEQTSIKELIRSISIKDDNETYAGFLVNEIQDADDTPDMLYVSNGDVISVAVTTEVSVIKTSQTQYELTIRPTQNGWNYGHITDPTLGYSTLTSIIRKSDGKEISLRNFWQTDRTLVDGKDWLYESNLHFIDEFSGSTQSYILTFEPTPEIVLEVASVDGIPAEKELAEQPVDVVTVNFSKSIIPESFTADDITFNIQAEQQDASLIGISTNDNKSFALDLSAINEHSPNGYYTLSIQTSGITDAEGFSGKTGKQVGWIMFRGGLVQLLTSVWPLKAGLVERVITDAEVKSASRIDAVSESGDKAQYGSVVTLTATPATGYQFSSWSLNGVEKVSYEPTYTVSATSDLNIVANFRPQTFNVSIEPTEGGAVSGGGSGIYEFNTQLTLTATPEAGYKFDGWSVNGEVVQTEMSYELTVTQAAAISAVFSPIYIPGDANGDGVVNLTDAAWIVRTYVGNSPAGLVWAAADVNNDGSVNLSDARMAVAMYVGKMKSNRKYTSNK